MEFIDDQITELQENNKCVEQTLRVLQQEKQRYMKLNLELEEKILEVASMASMFSVQLELFTKKLDQMRTLRCDS